MYVQFPKHTNLILEVALSILCKLQTVKQNIYLKNM